MDEPYTASHTRFLEDNGIAHYRIPIQANKDPAVKTPDHIVVGILEILLNKANHPVLIHCNKGKVSCHLLPNLYESMVSLLTQHRTGCVVGCFRKLQGWERRDVLSEYLSYSWPKSRVLDEKFIEDFDMSRLIALTRNSGAALWQPTTSADHKERKDKPPNHLFPAPRVKVS